MAMIIEKTSDVTAWTQTSDDKHYDIGEMKNISDVSLIGKKKKSAAINTYLYYIHSKGDLNLNKHFLVRWVEGLVE